MERQDSPLQLETRFAGKPHRWQVYLSNIVGMGESPKVDDADFYWALLKDEIVRRLGNQKLCYVKIYGAKIGDEITGECRIDDICSPELSARVSELVAQWPKTQFASHKQFFFLRQEEETVAPYPYWGPEGLEKLRQKVLLAARMFHDSKDQTQYDTLESRLAQTLKDPTLAAECFSFLPEMCAENAFPDLSYSEKIDFQGLDESEIHTVYKSQLADYWPMWQALLEAFQTGAFGEETNRIYQEYIGASAIFSVIQKMRKDNRDLKGCRLTSLLFRMDKEFRLR